MALYCFDCRLKRNKMASPVFTKPDNPKEEPRIIGWCCVKCFKKRKVVERPAGIGWRKAWRDLFFAVKKKGKGEL